ncbi:MAG: hypothetical protein KTR15_12805 [Phycisphaeraceae bacterium]|nr:hypothetical protein [Phycisphaeraceae bacterium]
MRHDVLIIWGHGLPDLDRVLDLVRATEGFTIRRILVRDIDDMPRFVRSVYNFDYAPYRHLIDKTKYLLDVTPRAAFIVLENKQPEEHTVGTGRFAHTECRRMTALKRAVRERFNPTVDGKPTEHHVVHGTDHAGQTIATLNLLGYRKVDDLLGGTPTILETPDHLPPKKQWTLQRVELSKAYARIANAPGEALAHRVVPVRQTPHAMYLAAERGPYEQYWRCYGGDLFHEDHAPQAFDRLNERFDYLGEDYPDSYLLLEPLDDERYVLLDGVHRAAILLSQGNTHIIAAVADQHVISASEISTGSIDLHRVFDQTQPHEFAVMKSLPKGSPEPGSDIDLLCTDKVALGKQLMRNCRSLINDGYTIRLRDLPETNQAHLDILHGDKIALRLDLHEGLGAYQHIPVKETFAQRLMDRREYAAVDCPKGLLQLPVPDATDNLVLRYLEYQEWFDRRPDKIKHAEHIADRFASDPSATKTFYERLMQATNQRPTLPALRYCNLNLKRQCVWALWSLRDKLAYRLKGLRNIAVMALTRPGEFLSKLINKLTPSALRSRALQHKA